MYNVPLPAIIVFVLFSGIDKDMWRANFVCLVCLSAPMKAIFLFVVEEKFVEARVGSYAAAAAGVLIATPIANYLAKFVDPQVFKDLVRALTLIGAASMLAVGTPFAAWVTLAVAGCAVAMILLKRWLAARGVRCQGCAGPMRRAGGSEAVQLRVSRGVPRGVSS